MRTLAFDGRLGASGDMILGALLAVGADRSVLDPVESTLPVRYAVDSTSKSGIAATTVDVLLTDESDAADHESQPDGHEDDADHTHTDDYGHDHTHNHDHAEGHGPHRSYTEVLEIVDSMALPESVAADARGAFRLLGEAEAAVHGESLEEIRFHEVGADDAIADIVGAALLVDDLSVDRVVTTPLSVGGGHREMSHGTYPIPGPPSTDQSARSAISRTAGRSTPNS